MKNRIAFIIGFIIYSHFLFAYSNDNYNFSYSEIKGLSQSNVKAILQDSWGFMWFGTKNGLNRFDGHENKIYDCDDLITGTGNHNISCLFEDEDRNMWVGTDKGIYIYNPFQEKFRLFSASTKRGIKITDWVAKIESDLNGNIWMVIPNQGVFRYNKAQKQLYNYPFDSDKKLNVKKLPECLCVLRSGQVWVGTSGNGLYNYNPQKDSFTQHLIDHVGTNVAGDYIYRICEYGDYIAMGIHDGQLKKYNYKTNTFSIVNSPSVHYTIIREVACFDNVLWVGTENGLFIINEAEGKTDNLKEDPFDKGSLTENKIYSIYKDREGGIWVGTLFRGVAHLPKQSFSIEKFVPTPAKNSICGKNIREIKEDETGKIWIGTEDNGLSVFDPRLKTFRNITPSGGVRFTPLCMTIDQDKAWVGLFKNGVDIIDTKTYAIKHLSPKDMNLDESSIWAILQDKKGRIWIGNGWGVYSADKSSLQFKRHNEFGYNFIYDLYEDCKGRIWAGTMGSGVFKYTPETGRIEHYQHVERNPNSLASNSISSITEDKKGTIWFATDRGGICRYNDRTNNFKCYTKKNGLPDDFSYKIIEDNNGLLWFGTNHGLVRFNPEKETVRIFTKDDGLPNNQFNYKSALKASNGSLYFGTIDGLISFHTDKMQKNRSIPPVYITRLSIFNKEMLVGAEDSPLKESITHTNEVVLKHNQSNISFDFAALSYTAPTANKFRYKLENFDKEWTSGTNISSANYTNIPPGKYTFRVMAANNDGVWNEQGAYLEIVIKAPWWKTNTATAIFMILTMAILLYFLISYQEKQKNVLKEKQLAIENEKEKEIYSAKIEFFTNIAHEIRTPLTLINGPLEYILEKKNPDPTIQKDLMIMEQNVKRLLNLVNQLLDFRKVDEQKYFLNFSQVNINTLLSETVERFEPLIEQKEKVLDFVMSETEMVVRVDKEAITKIISNMMTNAMKFSDKYIRVELSTADNNAIIRVINDGKQISPELSEKVFEPFYSYSNETELPGTGIGLSLAKKLTQLNNAELFIDNKGVNTTFVLSIPLLDASEIKAEPEQEAQEITMNEIITKDEGKTVISEESEEIEAKEYTILIADDEKELLDYLSERLNEIFNVYTASNGKEALEILAETHIDLILSDVMMPVMDGLELCNTIKTNDDLAQIPVVLLTAKTDMDSKIKSLENGADAYIEKPVSFNYLSKHLIMLLKNREKEKKSFLNKPFFPIQKMKVSKNDEKLLSKIIELIENNLTEPGFNVSNLASMLRMSRSGLHHKIKITTSLSPVEFIKLIRLKKAAKLLQEGEYQIAEVCYMVGINSPSYFSKLFYTQFGVTPKEFSKNKGVVNPNLKKAGTDTEKEEKEETEH